MRVAQRIGAVFASVAAACALDSSETGRLVPGPAAVFDEEGPFTGLSLDGFDVIRDGVVATGDLELTEGENALFRVAYRKTGVANPQMDAVLQITGAGPVLETRSTLDTTSWRMGGVYAVDIPFAIPSFRYAGRASLYFLAGDANAADGFAVLWATPIFVHPVLHRGDEDSETLTTEFGDEFRPLRLAFVLGPGASIEMLVAPRAPGPAIGLVSRMLHDHRIPQGEEVCLVETMDGSGRAIANSSLLAGVHTAQGDYDFYPKGTVRSKKISEFRSWRADRPAADGGDFDAHLYKSELSMDITESAASLRFTYLLATGIVEVREVLIKTGPR